MLKLVEVFGECLIGSVRFDQKAVERNALKDFPSFGFARMEEVSAERKVGAEFNKCIDHLNRTTIRMKQEAAFWERVMLKKLEHPAPSAKTMQRGGAIELRREIQLSEEDFFLGWSVEILDPAIESDFANSSVGMGFEVGRQGA